MGRPDTPTREQTALLRKLAWATSKEIVKADANGSMEIHRKLDAWTVVLFSQL